MKQRTLRYAPGWEWHMLRMEAASPARSDSAGNAPGARPGADGQSGMPALRIHDPLFARWLSEIGEREDNHISVYEAESGAPVLSGSLRFQASEGPHDLQTLHFWLTSDVLVTAQTDLRLTIRMQRQPWTDMMERSESAAEAFTVIVSSILDVFHENLEKELGTLQLSLSSLSTRRDRADRLLERRRELLRLRHLFLPLLEAERAVKEAFLRTLTERDGYVRLTYKVERIDQLLRRYGEELDSLAAIDDVYAQSGAEKDAGPAASALILLLPALAVGSIWGLNVDNEPWLRHPVVIAFLAAIVVLISLALFALLRWRRQRGTPLSLPPAASAISSGCDSESAGSGSDNDRPLPRRTSRRRRK